MNRKRLAILKQIYRRIPEIDCIGKCALGCGTIAASHGEFVHITKITGVRPYLVNTDRCNFLVEGRCSIHVDRPTACRLYGVTEAMPCDWGCRAERMLTEKEAYAIMADVSKLFNEPVGSFVDNSGVRRLPYDENYLKGLIEKATLTK